MQKIKLYIFHPYSRIGGADLSLSRLINNLDMKKYNISFITLDKPKINLYLKNKIKIHIIKKKRSIFSLSASSVKVIAKIVPTTIVRVTIRRCLRRGVILTRFFVFSMYYRF